MSRARFVVVTLVVGMALAGEARAQPEVEIEVTDGGTPLSGIQISQFVDGIKSRKDATNATGQATLTDDEFDFADGETVSVWVRRCEDGEVEIVLVAEGEDDPCVEDDAAEGEDCGCERIGAFVWGGGPVRIDVGTGTVTQLVEPSGGTYAGGPIQLGLGVGYSRWPHVDRACNLPGVVGCELTDARAMYQAVLDWYFLTRVGLSLELNYTPGLEVDHTSFVNDDGFPEQSVTELDVLGIGLLFAVRQAFGAAGVHAVFGSLGPIYVVNLGDVRTDYGGSIGILEESRHDPGVRLGGRAGLDWSFGDGRWGSRFEIGGMTGEDPDIDTNWFLGWKLLFRTALGGL